MRWLELTTVVVLTAINALLSGSEIALVSLRKGQLEQLSDSSTRGKLIASLAAQPTRFLAACQVGITFAALFASAASAVSIADDVEGWFRFLGRYANFVAVTFVTVILGYFTLVFGELIPKRIAMQRATEWLLKTIVIVNRIAYLTRPVIWLLEKSTNIVVRFLGVDPHGTKLDISQQELRQLLESNETLTLQQRAIISGAIDVSSRNLSAVLVPRKDVVAVPAAATIQEAKAQLAEAGHSRAPVHTGDLDDVLGIVHLRDLNGAGDLQDKVRTASVLPESLNVLEGLRRLQQGRQQMALVVNEHGGVEGIVTVEDLLEEIVGEIYDEFDPDVSDITRLRDGSVLIPGSFPVHDLDDVGIILSNISNSYSTVAGYILEKLGHIPVVGEFVVDESSNIKTEVLEVRNRAITRVRVIPVIRD